MMLGADAPGTVAYFDVAPVIVPVGGGAQRLVLSCYELAWSGRHCCGLDEQATMETLLWRLEMAFRKTGGVPDRVALRAIRPLVTTRVAQVTAWSTPMARFGQHFGFEPVLVDRFRLDGLSGARRWLESSSYDSLDEYLEGLDILAGSADAERDALKPLPAAPFFSGKEAFRRVAADGFVLFAGDAYSVPHAYAGKMVWTRRLEQRVVIRSQDGKLLATHRAGHGHGDVFVNLSHFELWRRRFGKETYPLERTFMERFPQHAPFLSHLVTQRKQGAAASLRHILALTARHSNSQLQAAFETALEYNNLSHRFIQGILEDDDAIPQTESTDEPPLQGTLF